MRGAWFSFMGLTALVLLYVSAALALVTSLLVPPLFFIVGLGLCCMLQPRAGVDLMFHGFTVLGSAVRGLVAILFAPLSDEGFADYDVPKTKLPVTAVSVPLFDRLQREVAQLSQTRPASALTFGVDIELGISDQGGVRTLHIGVPLLHLLSVDELRACLAHEFAHGSGGHLTLARLLRAYALGSRHVVFVAAPINPAFWLTRVCMALIDAIYSPWSQQQEYACDRAAALRCGANHLASALRKIRDHELAYASALALALDHVEARRIAPRCLVTTCLLLIQRLTRAELRAAAVASDGAFDDLHQRTHPPFAHRLGVLRNLLEKPTTDARLALHALRLNGLSEAVTQASVTPRTWIDPPEFVKAVLGPAAVPAPQTAANSDTIELDHRDWRHRRAEWYARR